MASTQSKQELLKAFMAAQNQTTPIRSGGLQSEQRITHRQMCTACFNGPMKFVFPCGHKVCRDCAYSLQRCHECGRQIMGSAVTIESAREKYSGSNVIKMAESVATLKTGTYAMQAALAEAAAEAEEKADASRNNSSSHTQVELFGSSSINAPMCEICHTAPLAVELGCGHKTCSGCSSKLHACLVCGKLVMHRSLMTHKYRTTFDYTVRQHEADRKRILPSPAPEPAASNTCSLCSERSITLVMKCDAGCSLQTCGPCMPTVRNCPECGGGIKTIVSVGGEVGSLGENTESVSTSCQICDKSQRSAVMICKSGCKIDACGPCTVNHKKCFKCGRKIKDITMLSENDTGADSAGCDNCHMNSRTHLLKCRKHGCRHRVCHKCTKILIKCCGGPVETVGKISNLQLASRITTQHDQNGDDSSSSRGIRRKLFDSDEDSESQILSYQAYQTKMREKEAIELLLPPIRQSGGFMGY